MLITQVRKSIVPKRNVSGYYRRVLDENNSCLCLYKKNEKPIILSELKIDHVPESVKSRFFKSFRTISVQKDVR